VVNNALDHNSRQPRHHASLRRAGRPAKWVCVPGFRYANERKPRLIAAMDGLIEAFRPFQGASGFGKL
jgi:hypothetical protein